MIQLSAFRNSDAEMRSRYEFVIVGGGLYSLVLAGALIDGGISSTDILLVEGSNSFGGQFRSDLSRNLVLFDKGTRILYETGDQRADKFISRIVERCESTILSGNRRDIGGIFFRNHLETGSVFPSFRSAPVEKQTQVLGEILLAVERDLGEGTQNFTSLAEFFDSQFGPTAREVIHEAISSHVFNTSSSELSLRTLEMLPLSRLSGFCHQSMTDLSNSKRLRSRLAFPDQLRLPSIRENQFRGFYPTIQGIEKYVDVAVAILEEAGVQLLLGHSVAKIENSRARRGTVELLLAGASGAPRTVSAMNKVIWTSGPRTLAACAELDQSLLPADVSRKISITHLLSNNVDRMGELYYAYNYDSDLSLFRVTNYSAYCPGSRVSGLLPITVESFADYTKESDPLKVMMRDLSVFLELDSARELEIQIVGNSSGLLPQPQIDVEERWRNATHLIANRLQGSLCFPGLHSRVGKFLGRDLVNDLLAQCDQVTI